MSLKTLIQLYFYIFRRNVRMAQQNGTCFAESVCYILYVQTAQNREMNFDT